MFWKGGGRKAPKTSETAATAARLQFRPAQLESTRRSGCVCLLAGVVWFGHSANHASAGADCGSTYQTPPSLTSLLTSPPLEQPAIERGCRKPAPYCA